MVVSAAGIARLRSAFAATLDATATVYRRVQVPDTSGGSTDTYTLAASYPCRFSRYQITPREREGTLQVQVVSYWQFLFEVSAVIRNTDRIHVGSRVFEVVSGGLSSLALEQNVVCAEIT
jgi:hypothetical protein